ncbi:DUF4180 domain-containing protein [Streptomyces spirodelae]|uniref:DUF4180 domain-containing protein n=1 Tax=Streptomyces spirodelae TaxID=2812904 RepID=A0ABS3WQL5_9ACTN|nr:DUF4180 domain-containing protein [Streptomyces spirodelae]MBO8185413.1 DUF4180 domain-containing protein [Streptomyces spirodelae]
MSSSGLETINGVTVLVWDADGETIGSESDALDVIGNTSYQGAEWAVIPASRLDEAFFQLRTRLAGDVVQKFVQYGLRLAVVGDISRHLEGSSSLRDFVRECNRGRQTWFLTDLEELRERLRG